MNATLTATVERTWIQVEPDNDPDMSYLEQDEFADRLAEYRAGDFSFVGVVAYAELRFKTPQGGWTGINVIRTPGLWGIESDSGEDYLRGVGREEEAELADELAALGLSLPGGGCAEIRYV